jgi:amidase
MSAPGDPQWSATRIAAAVRAGELDPVEVVEASLRAIAQRDADVGAFIVVRADAARAEAAALRMRDDRSALPLAGVPVAIKDNLDVAGEATRDGSAATPATPVAGDHPTVARLRAAGAIVVGKTHVPELCVWGSTESSFGRTRNPWSLDRIVGGSSGGSAAAVAAGMVPVALGNDGMGSIRVPAAVCGLFGLKPGPGVVPAGLGASSWFGMAENGPLTTCVADADLLLSVLAGQPESGLAEPALRPSLRIAVSTKGPVIGTRVAPSWRSAATDAATLLASQGHTVTAADPPYKAVDALTLGARWGAGTAEDADDLHLDRARLQRRTRGHIRFGAVLATGGFAADRRRDSWVTRLDGFFSDHDVLLLPTLAQPPPRSSNWHERSWLANIWRDASYAPFAARFNLAGVPAASVPWGFDADGLPVAVQLVAPRGGEATLLSLAAQLEELRPWRRHAAGYDPPVSV